MATKEREDEVWKTMKDLNPVCRCVPHALRWAGKFDPSHLVLQERRHDQDRPAQRDRDRKRDRLTKKRLLPRGSPEEVDEEDDEDEDEEGSLLVASPMLLTGRKNRSDSGELRRTLSRNVAS